MVDFVTHDRSSFDEKFKIFVVINQKLHVVYEANNWYEL